MAFIFAYYINYYIKWTRFILFLQIYVQKVGHAVAVLTCRIFCTPPARLVPDLHLEFRA